MTRSDDAFLVQSAHGGRLAELDRPHPTITASDDRHGLVVHLRGTSRGATASSAWSTDEPMGTVTAGGGHHALVVTGRPHHVPRTTDTPLNTLCTGNNHALIMRNQTPRGDAGQMVTSVAEPVRTLTTTASQSLLVPYNGTGVAHGTDEPMGTQPANDRWALASRPLPGWALCPDLLIDEFGYRMLTAYEAARGMGFFDGYIPTDITKRDQMKLAGNAVTPPVMQWIIERLIEVLGPGMTITDLFCGAGGSSLGAQMAGAVITMAANHWATAIDVHQTHFPDARHACEDISATHPARYPRTNILIASPECTNHSNAKGISRRHQDPSLFDAPDPAAERSRATMWDVLRFTEQRRYEAVVVENVVDATRWVGWRAWCIGMEDLGYTMELLSINSQDHDVPQSRDRIYVVWVRNGIKVDLERERDGHCTRCDRVGPARQMWNPGRSVGVYRQQWRWGCTTCGSAVQPAVRPAADIIDWDLPCPRIGDRPSTKRLVPATRRRIYFGAVRHGWAPFVTNGAGNTYETTPGNRARAVHTSPLPTQQTTAQHALALPPSGEADMAPGA